MINWYEGYTCRWSLFAVDTLTWADGEEVAGFQSAKITRSADGSLIESGSFQFDGEPPEPGYYRLVLTARQTGGYERVEVATLLVQSTSADINYHTQAGTINGYSVLYPANTRKLVDGSYCPAGVDAAQYVGELLRESINAPVVVDTSFYINQPIVHDFGTTALNAAWEVLNVANAVLMIDGNGTVHVAMPPNVSALDLDRVNARLIVPGVKCTRNISNVPNHYVSVGEFETVEIWNREQGSEVSTVLRGYEVTTVDTSPTPMNGETLEAYTVRKMRESSTVGERVTYKREYMPGVGVYSVVYGSADVIGIDGNARIMKQSLDCSHGILITEESERAVVLWQG